MDLSYNQESATSAGNKYTADEAMMGTHYSNNPSDSAGANTMAMTKQQFIEYQRLKQQINKNIKKNSTQNFYLSDSPDAHRTINRRVQSITDEIAKQRQYLPQFDQKQNRTGMSNGPRKGDNQTPQIFTPDNRAQRNGGLQYGKNPNGQFISPEPNFGGNLANNKFNENLELFQNQQNLQASLLDRAGRVKNISSYKHEVQDVFNKQQVAQTRKKMIHMMENMPSTIGIFNNTSNNRPEIPFLNESYKGGSRGFKNQNKRLTSSFSRHDSQPKYQTMSKGVSKMSQYQKIHEFAKNYQRSIKKTRRNINNAYFDHIADEMSYNLNKTPMDGASNEALPPNLDYDMFDKPYSRKKQKNMSKTPVRGGKKSQKEKWPLVMDDQKMGFSQDEYGPHKYKNKKLKTPIKGEGSPRQFSPHGAAVGYVNYVNGVPVESSPEYRKAKKVTLPKGQKLPKLKQSPRREYYDSPGYTGTQSGTESKEILKNGAAKVRKSGKYASNMRSKSPQKDVSFERERQRLINQYDKRAVERQTDGKHVSISTSPLQSQDQQQINIILPKRDAKELSEVTPDKQQHQTMEDRKIGSAKSGLEGGILKNRSAHKRPPGTATHNQTMSNTKSYGGQNSGRNHSIGSRGTPQQRTKRSKSTKKSYKGSGPLPQKTIEKEPPSYLVKDQTHFKKQDAKASIMDLQIDQDDYQHLLDDDMDMISRHEVIYKILKDQLRNHQRELIKMKEEQKLGKLENKIPGSKKKPKPIDLSKFARHIKHFELYGPQRGVAPEIKRIIKNLTCQEHHFMYCPSCKQYEAKDFDPVQNIQKFMDYVKKEQEKLKKYNKAQMRKSSAGVIKSTKSPDLVEDSVSEITDLDEQEILHKYIQANMTEKERKKKEREVTQKRLYGHEDYQHKHICSTTHSHRPKSQRIPKKGPTVRVQLKEASDGVSMQDEENSAHQFSLHNKSMQADSEERLEAEMQTSAIVYKSKIDQTSIQDHKSMNIQTSEIEYKSNNIQTNVYPEGFDRCEMACQTDPKMTKPKTPVKKSQKLQTEKPRAACDMYKEDWVHSVIFKKAVKNEAIKRGLPFEEIEDDDDEDFAGVTDMQSSVGRTNSDYYNTQPGRNRLASMIMTGGDMQSQEQLEVNAQEGEADDTDNTAGREQAMHMSAIGFMKRFQEKGDIQMLTESEIRYIKKLLKEKNLNFWTEKSTLVDLHRHTKYTIRKVTSHMANIDNYQIFKRLKEPTREHTLYLVYRAERLFSAEAEAEKIFKLVAVTLFDAENFQRILDEKSIKREDQDFVDKRSILFNRIMSLMNNFLEVYRLFNNKMTFKGQPLRDYIVSEHERIQQCIEQIEAEKLANPEAAAIEDAKDSGKMRKNRTGYFARSFLNSPDKTGKKNPLNTESMAEDDTPAQVNNRYDQEGSKDLETPAALKPSDGADDLNDRRSAEDGPADAQEEAKDDKKGKEKRKPGPTVPAHIMEEDPYEEREKRFQEEQKEIQQSAEKKEDQENVGLQTIEAINQEVDQEQGEDKGLEGARGRSMAGLPAARGSADGDKIDLGVENAPQTIGQSDDFKLQTQSVWNKNHLQLDQDDSHVGNLTQAQPSAERNAEMKSNSKTVAMNHDNVINPVHFKPALSQGTGDTKDQGPNSQAVKPSEQNRPHTTETQAHVTPRLPGYDQEKIEEQRFEETEGNDQAIAQQPIQPEEVKEQREVTRGGEDDE